MKLVAWIIASEEGMFHFKLQKGVRYFVGLERIVARHIGPRPWAEMFFVDEDGYSHLVYMK